MRRSWARVLVTVARSDTAQQLFVADCGRKLAQALHADLQKLVARVRRDDVTRRIGARSHDTQHFRDKLGLKRFAIIHADEYTRRRVNVHLVREPAPVPVIQ